MGRGFSQQHDHSRDALARLSRAGNRAELRGADGDDTAHFRDLPERRVLR